MSESLICCQDFEWNCFETSDQFGRTDIYVVAFSYSISLFVFKTSLLGHVMLLFSNKGSYLLTISTCMNTEFYQDFL